MELQFQKESVTATWMLSESVTLRDLIELITEKHSNQNEGFFQREFLVRGRASGLDDVGRSKDKSVSCQKSCPWEKSRATFQKNQKAFWYSKKRHGFSGLQSQG